MGGILYNQWGCGHIRASTLQQVVLSAEGPVVDAELMGVLELLGHDCRRVALHLYILVSRSWLLAKKGDSIVVPLR